MAPATIASQSRDRHTLSRRSETTTTVTIVGLSILGAVSLGLLLVIVVTKLRRRRSRRSEEPLTEKTARTWRDTLAPWPRKSTEHRSSVDETQREVLIHKSLAIRAESRASGQISPASEEGANDDNNDNDNDNDLEEEQDLRTEWKQWEARIHHERSISAESHPALDPLRTNEDEQEKTQHLELLPPISAVSSLNWNSFNDLPQAPVSARTAGSPTWYLPMDHGHITYGRLATDEVATT
jgi:hypothetical protein